MLNREKKMEILENMIIKNRYGVEIIFKSVLFNSSDIDLIKNIINKKIECTNREEKKFYEKIFNNINEANSKTFLKNIDKFIKENYELEYKPIIKYSKDDIINNIIDDVEIDVRDNDVTSKNESNITEDKMQDVSINESKSTETSKNKEIDSVKKKPVINIFKERDEFYKNEKNSYLKEKLKKYFYYKEGNFLNFVFVGKPEYAAALKDLKEIKNIIDKRNMKLIIHIPSESQIIKSMNEREKREFVSLLKKY